MMNRYKEALEDLLDYLQEYHNHYHDDVSFENRKLLTELVETATPKKPITDGSTYLPSCNKVQYICPHCKQIMLRTICIKAHKPNYCYKCGGALDWSEDDD